MKIIAKTKDGFLLEANENDMAAMHGYTSPYADGYKRDKNDVGAEIPVTHAREAMEFVRRWAGSSMADATSKVKGALASLDKIATIFPPK